MPVPRALIIAASVSAALVLGGCGSKDDQTGASPTPATAAASTAPSTTSPPSSSPDTTDSPASTTPCPESGATAAVASLLAGAKLTSAGKFGCVYEKGAQTLTFQFVKASQMTHKNGKLPDLYTVFRKGAQNDKKNANLIHFTTVDIGETGYITSQYQNPQSNIRWIHQGGDLLSLKLAGFAKNDATRKSVVANLIKTAKTLDAAHS